MLLVGLAVGRLVGVALGCGVAHDPRGGVFIAVGGVFDQFLLGLLEALGLAAAGLLDGTALFAAALLEVVLVHCSGLQLAARGVHQRLALLQLLER